MRGTCRLASALVLGLTAACGGGGKPPAAPTPTTVPDDVSRLADAANAGGRLVGAAVNHNPLASEPAYGETLSRHFNYVTAEYEMKWDPIQAAGRGTYDYSGG